MSLVKNEKESFFLGVKDEPQDSSFYLEVRESPFKRKRTASFYFLFLNPTRQSERVGGRKMPSYGTPRCRP